MRVFSRVAKQAHYTHSACKGDIGARAGPEWYAPKNLVQQELENRSVWVFDDLGVDNRETVVFRPFWDGSTFTDTGSFLTYDATHEGPHNETINVLWADGHVKSIKKHSLHDVAMAKRVWP